MDQTFAWEMARQRRQQFLSEAAQERLLPARRLRQAVGSARPVSDRRHVQRLNHLKASSERRPPSADAGDISQSTPAGLAPARRLLAADGIKDPLRQPHRFVARGACMVIRTRERLAATDLEQRPSEL